MGDDGMSELFRQYHADYMEARGRARSLCTALAEGTYKLTARPGGSWQKNAWPIRAGPGTGAVVGEMSPGRLRRVVAREGEWLQLGGDDEDGRGWTRATQAQGRWAPVDLARKQGRDELYSDAREQIKTAQGALEDMQRELRECPAHGQAVLRPRLTVLRDECNRLGRDLEATRPLQGEADRHALLEGSDGQYSDGDPRGTDARARLMETTAELGKRAAGLSRHTDQIVQMTEETERAGQQSLSELKRQRETIERAQGRVGETNTELARARATIGRMHQRVVKNRLLLWGIIALLLGMIGAIIYFSVRKHFVSDAPPPAPAPVSAPPPITASAPLLPPVPPVGGVGPAATPLPPQAETTG